MKNHISIMATETEYNVADELHKKARLQLVYSFPYGKRAKMLKQIYGENFDRAETFPLSENQEVIRHVLANFNPQKTNNPLVIEEYRRLERVLDYQRRTFCLDLEGLIISNGNLSSGIEKAVLEIKQRHGLVVSTAAPEKEAAEILSKTKLKRLLVFGDLASPRGKKYAPIDEFFGYAHPENHLVAVGHSFEDTPSDLKIPFIYLDVKTDKLGQALLSGVAFIEGKQPELRVAKRTLTLPDKELRAFYIIH